LLHHGKPFALSDKLKVCQHKIYFVQKILKQKLFYQLALNSFENKLFLHDNKTNKFEKFLYKLKKTISERNFETVCE
jgi:hypothetical protein